MERNLLLTIEYDGSEFSGWQRQPERRTVQGELERVLSKVCGVPVQINGTSRTDAGVHGLGQRASFKLESGIPTDKIKLAANNILAGGKNLAAQVGDVRILEVKEMPSEFHARFDAKGKKYRYVIYNGDDQNIFRRKYCYQVQKPLDVTAMQKAAKHIVGTHDFACFQSAGGQERETTVRTVFGLDVFRNDQDVVIEISGDGFLYNMVRIITGTLVEVGLGRRNADDLVGIIESADRTKAGHKAPAEGLYLVEVYYE
ncbi:MAG: tRNA pseudouridine(38-40) synthase TruA [Firmicutes bacterium]|nr:tRNA pseudouridine(38-40) synthase TruA [Bacillota bacterium]